MPDEAEDLQRIMQNVQQDHARLQRFHGVTAAASQAQRANVRLAQLEKINEMAPRGVLAAGVVTGKGAMDLLGLVPQSLGLKSSAGTPEVMRKLGELSDGDIVRLTNGAASKAELQGFLEAMPQLGSSQQGSRQVLDFLKSFNARKIALASAAERYRQENGTLDGGFVNEVAAVHSSMPLTPPPAPQEEMAAQPPAAAPSLPTAAVPPATAVPPLGA